LPPAPPAQEAQQPQPPQQPQPEIQGPLTRARARALERQNLAPSDAIRLIRKVHLAAISHQFKTVPHFDVSEGPSIVSDEYNLPKQFPGESNLNTSYAAETSSRSFHLNNATSFLRGTRSSRSIR
jgi:hypothetical protein